MSTKEICRVPWVRDEVILAYAVVLRSEKKRFTEDSAECQCLSQTLNMLPIIPLEKRVPSFRNTAGIRSQLGKLASILYDGKIIGSNNNLFWDVLDDFADRTALLSIANSISQNIDFAADIPQMYFHRPTIFREGILLGGIHCYLENKSDAVLEDHCEICGMFPEAIYASGISFNTILERHCLTPPEMLNRKTPLNKKNMLTVCPTCHKVLHEYRPWITPNNLSTVLQWK